MTAYPTDFFDSTPGYLPQLILAAIAQDAADSYFIANLQSSVDTSYAASGIQLGLSVDNSLTSFIQLDIKLPVIQKTPLLDKIDLAERIVSMTTTDVGQLSIPRKSSYTITGYPVPALPAYLTDDRNILERRIGWLVLGLVNLKTWIEEWNVYTTLVIAYQSLRDTSGSPLAISVIASSLRSMLITMGVSFFKLSSTIAIADNESAVEAYTDYLIEQLNHPIEYRFGLNSEQAATLFNVNHKPAPATIAGEISGTASESSFYDPGNTSNSTTPDYTLNIPNSGAQPSVNQVPDVTPQPTLPNC